MEFGKAHRGGKGMFSIGAAVAMGIAIYAAVPISQLAPGEQVASASAKPAHARHLSTTTVPPASSTTSTTEVATTTAPSTTVPPTTTSMPAPGGVAGGSSSGGSGAPGNSYGPGDKVTAICMDGSPSFSQTRSGTCSHHGGVKEWRY